MNKFNELKESWLSQTEKSIKNIEEVLFSVPKHYEQDFHKLVTWITNTDISHYDFMPKGWENCITDAKDFDSFLHIVHHAMVDDGDMTFVNVKEHGSFIVFAHENDDYFNILVEKHLENVDSAIKNYLNSFNRIIETTDNENTKETLSKRLINLPKSIKDLEYSYHTDVNLFINEVENHHRETIEKHAQFDEKMKKFRMKK